MNTTSIRSRTTPLVGLILAVSMTTIDQTIVALSAPTIESDLAMSHDAMQWAVNIYLIATAAFFLLGGRLADVFGHRRMALIGIAAFGATSLLCGLAPTGDLASVWLIGMRALQGIAGALMYPAAIGLVVQTFPKAGRAKAMATFFSITGAMTAVGPIAGGILSQWTWRSIFWINVPIAIAAFVLVALTAPRGERRREPVDLVGAALVAVGLGAIVFGLQQAGTWGWTSPAVIGALIGGILFLGLFVLAERRARRPLIDLRVYRDRGFVVATLSMLFASMAFLATFYFLSVYGQISLGLSAMETGLLFLKFFIGFVVAAQLGSRRFDRLGARSVLMLGGLVGAVGFAWLAYAVTVIPSNPGQFLNSQTAPIVLAGAGIGFMLSAASTDAVNRAIGAAYGEVTAISQTMRNFGGALGIAVFSSLVGTVLLDKLTTSFQAVGGTAADAQTAVDRISGVSGGGALADVPAAVHDQIMQLVQQGYADAVSWAFFGAAIAMAVVAILGALYPRGEISSTGAGIAARDVDATV